MTAQEQINLTLGWAKREMDRTIAEGPPLAESLRAQRDALAAEVVSLQEALRLLRKERERGLNVVPLLRETCDYLDALGT